MTRVWVSHTADEPMRKSASAYQRYTHGVLQVYYRCISYTTIHTVII